MMLNFIKKLFKIQSTASQPYDYVSTDNDLEEFSRLDDLNRKAEAQSEKLHDEYVEQQCSFDPYSFQLPPKIVDCHLNSIDLAFLKYINGQSISNFEPAQYWFYEYGFVYKDEIYKLISGGFLKLSKFGLLEKQTVSNIKEILRSKGLPVTGKKAELINRVEQNFSAAELENYFPIGKGYYKLTPKGKQTIVGLKKSITKNLELEDECLSLILSEYIDEAYKKIALYRADKKGTFGLGIDWAKEARTGLDDFSLNRYLNKLLQTTSEVEREVAACEILTQMLGMNDAYPLIKRILPNDCDNLSYNTTLSENSQLNSFKSLEVAKYEVVAALDEETCPICGNMDGCTFLLSEAQIGVNCPPFHNGCRCCIAPVTQFSGSGSRIARGDDGKTYYVPEDMTYNEWHKKYMDNK